MESDPTPDETPPLVSDLITGVETLPPPENEPAHAPLTAPAPEPPKPPYATPTSTQQTPLLAFLIPTRDNFDGLLRMLDSLRSHPDSARFEIRVWMDNDDPVSLARTAELIPFDVHLHTGPRRHGYNSTGAFCSEMACASRCPWVCICDDDNRLEGPAFLDALVVLPTSGLYILPEVYQLGPNNRYKGTQIYQYAFLPNGAWLPEVIGNPTDAWISNEFHLKRKWSRYHLPGVVMCHDWICRNDRVTT